MEQFSSLRAKMFIFKHFICVFTGMYCFLSLDLCGVFGGIQAER